jgi:hypothetical protein
MLTYTKIATVTVGSGGSATINFSSIPQTFMDLKLVWSARSARVANTDDMVIGFNGVNTNLTGRYLWGTGSAAQSGTDTQVLVGEYPTANSTASTFSNCEVTIPNYTSANYKSFGAETVGENNATLAYATIAAGLWSSTAAITQVTLKTGSASNLTEFSTATLYGIGYKPQATGGSISSDGTYWYHAFTSTGLFTPSKNLQCDVLVVAGGGSGGGYTISGGGGAGGLRTLTGTSLATGNSYAVTVGGGGATASNGSTSGSNSSFSVITSAGGGGGAVYGGSGVGKDGGSGGGGARQSVAGGSGNTPSTSPSQGNNGGGGVSGDNLASGGGGAGAVGGTGASSTSGAGGAGINTYSSWLSATGLGVSGYVAGGGGGGCRNGYSPGAGGSGGGGAGAAGLTDYAGTANTGGGGGGSSYNGSSGSIGGTGGSGVVILRYKI